MHAPRPCRHPSIRASTRQAHIVVQSSLTHLDAPLIRYEQAIYDDNDGLVPCSCNGEQHMLTLTLTPTPTPNPNPNPNP